MGGKSQQSTQQVTIPPEVLARYNSVNAQAQQVAQTPFQQYSSDPNAFVAPLTAAQNMGLQQTSDYANAAQAGIQTGMDMTKAASGVANPSEINENVINQYMNPYMNDVVKQQSALMNQQFQQAQAGQMGNAIKSGAFGGDRGGIAAANLQQQQALAYGNAMAPVLQQGYNTALQTATGQQALNLQAQQANLARQMQGAQQYANLAGMGQTAGLAGAQALMGAGQVQQQTQQAGQTALYNQFTQQQSYPFQVMQFLANIAEGTGALSGQTTTSTQPGAWFSDRRLKENIKRIGTAKNGTPIHSFNYKDDPEKLTRLGFMADEVEGRHPEAVGLAGGYKTVDYDKAVRAAGGSVQDWNQGDTYGRGGLYAGGTSDGSYNPWDVINQREAAFQQQRGAAPSESPYTAANRHVPTFTPQHHDPLRPAAMPKPAESTVQQVGSALSGVKDAYGTFNTLNEAKTRFGNWWNSGSGDNSGGGGGGGGGGSDNTNTEDVTKYRGGLARDDGGVVLPKGPDVVTPTAEYKQGLAEAQQAQVRANETQAAERQHMADLGINTAPDLSPFGQMLAQRGMANSMNIYGAPGGFYDPKQGGNIFAARGGLVGYAEGGAPDDPQDDKSGLGEYQSDQNPSKMDIPDDKPNVKPLQPGQMPQPQKSGLGEALGIVKNIAGLATMFGAGGLARRRRGPGGDVSDDEGLDTAVRGLDVSDRGFSGPDLSASNATPAEQARNVMERLPPEEVEKVIPRERLTKMFPATQEAPAPGLQASVPASQTNMGKFSNVTPLSESTEGEVAPWGGLEPPSPAGPTSRENLAPSVGDRLHGARPVEGSGFDQPLRTDQEEFARPATPAAPEPGLAAAEAARRLSPEAGARAATEERDRAMREASVEPKQPFWDVLGVTTPTAEKAEEGVDRSFHPATLTSAEAVAGPGLAPAAAAAAPAAEAAAPAPAPGLAAGTPRTFQNTPLTSLAEGAPGAGGPLPTFAREGMPSPVNLRKDVTSPTAPIAGATAAPAGTKFTPTPPARPTVASAAQAATKAPQEGGNPVQQFFQHLFGGAQEAGQNVVGGVRRAGEGVSGAITGGINQVFQGSPKMMPPANQYVARNVDPRLQQMITEGTKGLPQGYTARLESGFREGDPRFHGRGMATDVAIYDSRGNKLANYQDPTTFRMYEQLAQNVRIAQQRMFPELNDQFRWGGYFSGGKGTYGAMDLMHFDIGGRPGLGMAGGSWEKGLTPQQMAYFPGAQSVGMGQSPAGAAITAATASAPAGGNTSSHHAYAASNQDFGTAYKSGIQGILGFEEKFRERPYWDTNGLAIGYGTHQIMGVDGRMRPVQAGDTITPEAAYQNMATRLRNEFIPAARAKVGEDVWRSLPRNVRDGLGSVIWNHGHLPDSVAAAARTGDRNAIANAVANLPANSQAARDRRLREAAHIRGGG